MDNDKQKKEKLKGQLIIMGQPKLHTDNLAVGYNGRILIDKINISVCGGQIVTLIGPNGAGKSTILKTIAKQLDMVSGMIYIDKTELAKANGRELAQKMSVMMTQQIEPELMTCRDVIEWGRYPYTGQMGILSDNDREKVNEAMALTNVTAIADNFFSQISDGQRQRVMLARAICQEPEILILDEPTSFLDIHHKLDLLNILQTLVRQKNIAVIMSLHEIDMAQKISDYVVCIKDYIVDRCGIANDIFTDDYIPILYDMEKICYNRHYGTSELYAPKGEPKIFVIAGNGTGCNLFRKLQRAGIPFAVGILSENDIDFSVAQALAAEVISVGAFERITSEQVTKAEKRIISCRSVICCIDKFGEYNSENMLLREFAEKNGFLLHNCDIININGSS